MKTFHWEWVVGEDRQVSDAAACEGGGALALEEEGELGPWVL